MRCAGILQLSGLNLRKGGNRFVCRRLVILNQAANYLTVGFANAFNRRLAIASARGQAARVPTADCDQLLSAEESRLDYAGDRGAAGSAPTAGVGRSDADRSRILQQNFAEDTARGSADRASAIPRVPGLVPRLRRHGPVHAGRVLFGFLSEGDEDVKAYRHNRLGLCPQYLRGRSSLLCACDASSAAGQIERLIQDHDLQRELIEKGRKRMAAFAMPVRRAEKILAICQDLAAVRALGSSQGYRVLKGVFADEN